MPLTSDNVDARRTKTKLHSDLTRGSGKAGPRGGDKMAAHVHQHSRHAEGEIEARGDDLHVRSGAHNGVKSDIVTCLLRADFVAEVGCLGWIAVSLRSRTGFDLPALRLSTQLRHYAVHRTGYGGGRGNREGGRLKFWAMAARTNLFWAPRGPRSRSRPSLRMRFKCANRISIFLRSRCDCSKPSVPANDRAMSRACSWMSRGILRAGSFGQHCGLSGHTSQSSLLARYRSVLPSCTVPLVPSRFPPGQW